MNAPIHVECLVYGERERRHDLLASSLSREDVPPELLRLTRLPVASVVREVRWVWLFGCAPAGGGWALWRAFPDPEASQAGVVQVHVRWMSATAVGGLKDLEPVLRTLPRGVAYVPAPRRLELAPDGPRPSPLSLPPGYIQVVQGLLESGKPVVVSADLDVEGMICALWRSLWPEARRRLSCVPGFGPQSAGALGGGSIVVTPAPLLSRWSRHPVVEHGRDPRRSAVEGVGPLCEELPEFVRWFVSRLEQPPDDLKAIHLLIETARLHERVATGTAEPSDEAALLRKVAFLVPDPGVARALKADLVERTGTAMGRWDARQIGELASLKLDAFDGAEPLLTGAIAEWVEQQLKAGFLKALGALLVQAAAAHEPEHPAWWERGVWQGVGRWFRQLRGEDWRAFWKLCVTSEAVMARLIDRLWELVLGGERVEPELLEAIARAPGVDLLHVPGRARLWKLLPEDAAQALALSTARAWAEALPAGPPDAPEEPLRPLISRQLGSVALRRGGVAPSAVVFVAEHADEREVLRWFWAAGNRPFRPDESARLGRIALERHWRTFARMLRDAYDQDRPDLIPAMRATRTLLPWSEQIALKLMGGDFSEPRARRPLDLFVSCAVEDDLGWELLRAHLEPLVRDGFIRHWDDRRLQADDRDQQLHDQLERAELVLLLVTEHFLESGYCEREAEIALRRFEEGQCLVVPIIFEECDWRTRPFAWLAALPPGGHAVTSGRAGKPDEAMADVGWCLREWIVEWLDREARSGEAHPA